MPTYSYLCEKCSCEFEVFFHIKDYQPSPRCTMCKSKNTHRMYTKDVLSQSASVKKSDSELKTLGDLAMRNSERLSDDEKLHLHQKHNSYREDGPQKELPKGMSRVKKQPKTLWPGAIGKQKRKPRK